MKNGIDDVVRDNIVEQSGMLQAYLKAEQIPPLEEIAQIFTDPQGLEPDQHILVLTEMYVSALIVLAEAHMEVKCQE